MLEFILAFSMLIPFICILMSWSCVVLNKRMLLDFDMDFDDDHYGSFEETDFSSLADMD